MPPTLLSALFAGVLVAEPVDPFVGRGLVPTLDEPRFQAGVDGQVVPLDLVLASTRSALIDASVATACSGTSTTACQTEAQAYTGEALDVIDGLSDSESNDVLAASANPKLLATALKSAGVTRTADVAAVQQYVSTVPLAERQAVLGLARHLADDPSAVRLEPYAGALFASCRVRAGVPVSVGATSSLGNVNLDLATGWTFAQESVDLGVTVGLVTYLPTSSDDGRVSLMADLFSAPRFLYGALTFAPYVVGGLEGAWLSWQAHVDLWVQARVAGDSAGSNADVLHYGTSLTLGPRAAVSLVAQLEGLEGLHHASAFRSLFVVGGLQARLWAVRLGLAAQVPVLDRAAEELGSYGGVAVGALAKYTFLARTGVEF